MNVHAKVWRELGYTRSDLEDPRTNIEAGAMLLKRIIDRLPDASIRRIGTLYNNLSARKISDYGARLEAIYREKPWLKDD